MERGESVSGLNWKKIIPLLLALIVLGNYLYSTLGVTEEQRILRVVDRAERAVIDKSFFNLEQVLSSHYRDRSGLTKMISCGWRHSIFDLRTRSVWCA